MVLAIACGGSNAFKSHDFDPAEAVPVFAAIEAFIGEHGRAPDETEFDAMAAEGRFPPPVYGDRVWEYHQWVTKKGLPDPACGYNLHVPWEKGRYEGFYYDTATKKWTFDG